jgi:hypothetical protein
VARDLAARLHVAAGRLFVALWGLVLLDLGLHALPVRRAAEGVLVALMGLALLKASRHIRILALLLAGGTLALAWRGGGWAAIDRGLAAALPVGAFLPVVALVRATVQASPTVPAIRERLGTMSEPERQTWMTGGAQLLGAILTLGYVSVQRPMLPDTLTEPQRIALAESGIRGLGLSMTWSPFFVASAVASQLVRGVAAWQIVAVGLVLSALGGTIAHLMFNRALDGRAFLRAMRRLGPIVTPTALLVGAVIATSAASGWNVLQSVVVVVPACCALYVAARARGQARTVLAQVLATSGRMSDEVLILTASTVFGAAVAGLAMPADAAGWLRGIDDRPALLIGLAVAAIALPGTLGLHPMVSASVVVPGYLALGLPIADVVLSHVVVLAWSLSAMVAAWTLPVVVTSAAFEVPVRRLVFGANLRFVLVYGLAAIGALAVINAVLMR